MTQAPETTQAAADAGPRFASEAAGPRFTSEAPGLTAMADALVAHGRLTRASATQMLNAELAAYRGEHSSGHGGGSGGATWSAPAPHAATHTPAVRPELVDAPKEVLLGEGRVNRPSDESGATPRASTGASQTEEQSETSRTSTASSTPDELPPADNDPLFAPPPTPEGYTLTLNPAVKMDVADIRAVQQWFHAMRLPAPIAQSIYSEVERMSLSPPDGAAIARMNAATMSQLSRAWGERTATMMGHAKRLIDAAARQHPGLKPALARGPGSNPLVVRQLAEHAARLYGGANEQKGN